MLCKHSEESLILSGSIMATNNKKQEIKKPRDDSKDTNLLLACILRELETLNKRMAFIEKMEAIDHGIEL